MKTFLKKIGFALMLTLTVTSFAFAQSNGDDTNALTTRPEIIPSDFIPENEDSLLIPNAANQGDTPQEQFFGGRLLPTLTNAIIALAGGLAFVFMIVGGIQILTAYGNEEKVSAGKKTITYAIVGLLIAILSYAIVSIISGIQLGGPPQQGDQTEQTETTTETTNET